MNLLQKPSKILLFLLVSLFFTQMEAQLFGPSYKACLLIAPEKSLEGIQKIAILHFENRSSYYNQLQSINYGSKLADFMTAELLKEDRGIREGKLFTKGVHTNIFEVVERNRIDKITREQSFQVSGAVDDNQAVEIGRLLGIDVIILGSLSYNHKDEKDQQTTEKKSKDGKITRTTTYTLTRTLTAEASMKIITIKTGQILGVYNPRTTTEDIQSSTKGYPRSTSLKSVDDLANTAFRHIANLNVNYFCPHFDHTNIHLEKIKIREFKNDFKTAHSYLKNGDIKNGYKIFQAIYDKDNYNPKAAYNLGTIYEATGDFEKAQEYYSIATQLDTKKKAFLEAQSRAKKGIQMVKDLADRNIIIEKYNFGPADLNSSKVVTKGSRSTRVSAYSQPHKKSVVVGAVPGGLSFEVEDVIQGVWYKVKLLGGKEGYFHQDDVKED